MHAELREIILDLLDRYYTGTFKYTEKSVLVECPWHDDSSPSCNIYFDTGIFYCWSCGQTQRTGFAKGMQALGVPQKEIPNLSTYDNPFKLTKVLDTFDSVKYDGVINRIKDNVKKRSSIPCTWDYFRGITPATMHDPWFYERLDPSVVFLKDKTRPTEIARLPRLAFRLGGRTSDCLHEVYVRMSSLEPLKTINTPTLSYRLSQRLHEINCFSDNYLPLIAPFFGLSLKAPDKYRCGRIDPRTKAIFIVEGAYDAAYLTQCHMQLRKIEGQSDTVFETIALLGTSRVDNFVEMFLYSQISAQAIKRKIPIILALDHDRAGREATEEAQALLTKHQFPKQLIKVLDYPTHRGDKKIKDPADLTFSEYVSSVTTFIQP